MIDAIIIENEKPQIEYITKLLAKNFPEINVTAICSSVPDGIEKVLTLQPQLLFLDVELPPFTGFDLLEKTRGMGYEVIFTTSFNQYAIKAIKFCALDYIEKPFGVDELKVAIDKFKNSKNGGSRRKIEALLNNLQAKNPQGKQIGLPVLGGIEFIRVDEIIRCQSSNNYTDIFLTTSKTLTITKTLKIVEDMLKDHQFYRVHDSHMVNMNMIKSYMKGGEGGVVYMTNKSEVDVSRRRKDGFLNALKELGMI